MIIKVFPCKGCKKREAGCHSRCAEYKTAKANYEKEKEDEKYKGMGTTIVVVLKVNDIILVSGSYSESTYALALDGYSEKTISSSASLNEIIESRGLKNNAITKSAAYYYAKRKNEKKNSR